MTTPGTQGGLNWAPMTFSPLTNLVYVPASIINSRFGPRYLRPPGQPRSGILAALDPTTNKIVWQKRTKFPLGTGSGLLATASGLIFHGESDGHIVAYDIRNGDTLWKFQTGAGADAPVATYEVGGEAVRRDPRGRQPLSIVGARRLSLGVQARRKGPAAAGAAGTADHAAGNRAGEIGAAASARSRQELAKQLLERDEAVRAISEKMTHAHAAFGLAHRSDRAQLCQPVAADDFGEVRQKGSAFWPRRS